MQLCSAAGFNSKTGVTIKYRSVFDTLLVTVHDPKHVIAERAAKSGSQVKLQFTGFTALNGGEGPLACYTATAHVCGPNKTPPITKGATLSQPAS